MTVYILWSTVHCVNMEVFYGVYKERKTCLDELKRQQELIDVELIEFHIQETKLR